MGIAPDRSMGSTTDRERRRRGCARQDDTKDQECAANSDCHVKRQAGQYYVRIRVGSQPRPDSHNTSSGGQPSTPTLRDRKVWQEPKGSRHIGLKAGDTEVQANVILSMIAEEAARCRRRITL